MFRKLEFDKIYYAYLNKSPFKYYISILGGMGVKGHAYFAYLGGWGVKNSGKLAYIILARSLICYDIAILYLKLNFYPQSCFWTELA